MTNFNTYSFKSLGQVSNDGVGPCREAWSASKEFDNPFDFAKSFARKTKFISPYTGRVADSAHILSALVGIWFEQDRIKNPITFAKGVENDD